MKIISKKELKKRTTYYKIVLKRIFAKIFYFLLRPLPLQNKVVASNFYGAKYGDNTKYIIEELHKINKDTKFVWIQADDCDYEVPKYIKIVKNKNAIQKLYEYYTAAAWLDTHHIYTILSKRKTQLFIETWHGGLKIKKILGDRVSFDKYDIGNIWTKRTVQLADIFVSNCTFLTDVYRTAFHYNDFVWECGFPRNDILINGDERIREKVFNRFGFNQQDKFILYAPTYRDLHMAENTYLEDLFTFDYKKVCDELEKKTNNKWHILLKLHPKYINKELKNVDGINLINATKYPDMQELILSCDMYISDFSSGIFDAAIRGIPCLSYAKDYDCYEKERGGCYFSLEELPFPLATNENDLEKNIISFDLEEYKKKWNKFANEQGMIETGHAAKDVAILISDVIENGKDVVDGLKNGK